MIIKALSMWQPWASMVAFHFKQYETRSWSTNYRGWLAIHATQGLQRKEQIAVSESFHAKGFLEAHSAGLNTLPTSCIVAIAELYDIERVEDRREKISANEYSVGDWSDGRYAWVFARVYRVQTDIRVDGKQGLWNLNLDKYPLKLGHVLNYVSEFVNEVEPSQRRK